MLKSLADETAVYQQYISVQNPLPASYMNKQYQ